MTAAKRILPYTGIAAGVGTAVYVAQQSSEVNKLMKQRNDIEKSATQSKTQIRKYESQVLEQESLIKVLQQQGEVERKAMSELDKSLAAARAKVAQLESQHSLKMDDLKRIDQEASDAAAKIVNMRGQIDTLHKSAATQEQNLKIMQQEVLKAKDLMNPLNHPKIKNMLGR
jgi:chromosome segregation ATPase